jgi:hypothetical protein
MKNKFSLRFHILVTCVYSVSSFYLFIFYFIYFFFIFIFILKKSNNQVKEKIDGSQYTIDLSSNADKNPDDFGRNRELLKLSKRKHVTSKKRKSDAANLQSSFNDGTIANSIVAIPYGSRSHDDSRNKLQSYFIKALQSKGRGYFTHDNMQSKSLSYIGTNYSFDGSAINSHYQTDIPQSSRTNDNLPHHMQHLGSHISCK